MLSAADLILANHLNTLRRAVVELHRNKGVVMHECNTVSFTDVTSGVPLRISALDTLAVANLADKLAVFYLAAIADKDELSEPHEMAHPSSDQRLRAVWQRTKTRMVPEGEIEDGPLAETAPGRLLSLFDRDARKAYVRVLNAIPCVRTGRGVRDRDHYTLQLVGLPALRVAKADLSEVLDALEVIVRSHILAYDEQSFTGDYAKAHAQRERLLYNHTNFTSTQDERAVAFKLRATQEQFTAEPDDSDSQTADAAE